MMLFLLHDDDLAEDEILNRRRRRRFLFFQSISYNIQRVGSIVTGISAFVYYIRNTMGKLRYIYLPTLISQNVGKYLCLICF